VLIAREVKEKQLYGQQQRAAPERLFKMAFFHRMFGGGSPIVMQPTLAEVKLKTFWDRLNAGTLLPILVALTLAIAAWKMSEISSWKSTSEAGKEPLDGGESRWGLSRSGLRAGILLGLVFSLCSAILAADKAHL
jgi:hypothetical protein